jgi:signal transduction histidine kinase
MKVEQFPKLEKVKFYSIITLLLVISGGAISVWITNRIDYYTAELVHTEEVLQLTHGLYANVLERETSIRGYAITGNDSFLANYETSKIVGKEILPILLDLTKDNVLQQTYLKELQVHIANRLKVFELTKTYYQQYGSLDGFISPEKIENAVNGHQSIKLLINKINEEESRLLLKRNQMLINNIAVLPMIVGLISFLSIFMGVLTLFSIFHYKKATTIKDEKIRVYQETLKEKIDQLNESNDELKQFAYIASHDLQEPLRKITSFSDLLVEQFSNKLEGEGHHYLERITSSANRMRRLITDLLEYSRAGRESEESVKRINLDDIMNLVIEDLEVPIKETKATIYFQNLPTVVGKETEFSQVFQNLLSNSLKFSRPDIPLEITVSTENVRAEVINKFPQLDKSSEYLLVSIKDNGIGFEQNFAERIFTIFQRLHGKNEFEGTGIGLSITRKIVEKYGGVIFAEGIPNQGATFKIILPKPEQG